MNARDIFEEGDTGEAILPIVPVSAQAERFKVNGVGAGGAPGGNPLHRDKTRDAETRLAQLWAMTDSDRSAMLAWISGYAPDVFDAAVER